MDAEKAFGATQKTVEAMSTVHWHEIAEKAWEVMGAFAEQAEYSLDRWEVEAKKPVEYHHTDGPLWIRHGLSMMLIRRSPKEELFEVALSLETKRETGEQMVDWDIRKMGTDSYVFADTTGLGYWSRAELISWILDLTKVWFTQGIFLKLRVNLKYMPSAKSWTPRRRKGWRSP